MNITIPMIKRVTVLILLSTSPVFAQGGVQFKNISMSASHTRFTSLWFDFDAVDYVNGGITFTYPAGTYTTTPTVQITIALKNAVYSALESYVAEITANSTASTTVRVNKVIGGVSTEAATNDVTVHCYALGNGQ